MMNCTVIMGRITADPELRTTMSGVMVTNFTVALDRTFGENKVTDFIPVVAWRNTADFICKYFRKGSMICIQGQIQSRKYQDKQGNNRTAVEVCAENVSFCGEKQQPASFQTGSQDILAGFEEENDLPWD